VASAFFQNTWTVCSCCDRVGHVAAHCPVSLGSALPSLDFSSFVQDDASDDDEGEKETSEDEGKNDKKDPKCDGKHTQDPPKNTRKGKWVSLR
jgi:hypothetical protein